MRHGFNKSSDNSIWQSSCMNQHRPGRQTDLVKKIQAGMSVPRGANTANQGITRLCTVTGDIQLHRNSRVFERNSARVSRTS